MGDLVLLIPDGLARIEVRKDYPVGLSRDGSELSGLARSAGELYIAKVRQGWPAA